MIWKVVDECPNLEVSDEGMVRDRQTGKLRRGKRGTVYKSYKWFKYYYNDKEEK